MSVYSIEFGRIELGISILGENITQAIKKDGKETRKEFTEAIETQTTILVDAIKKVVASAVMENKKPKGGTGWQ